MILQIIKGVYRHTKTKKLYKVVGIGRSVDDPTNLLILYKQLYNSKLYESNIILKKGSIWVRKYTDFFSTNNGVPKFEKVVKYKNKL